MGNQSEDQHNVRIAFLLVIGAGLATCLGACVVFFPKIVKMANKNTLAISLGLSAGVMTYVSFIEISQKSYQKFLSSGLSHKVAYNYATLCFFSGVLLMLALNYTVSLLLHSKFAKKTHHHHHNKNTDTCNHNNQESHSHKNLPSTEILNSESVDGVPPPSGATTGNASTTNHNNSHNSNQLSVPKEWEHWIEFGCCPEDPVGNLEKLHHIADLLDHQQHDAVTCEKQHQLESLHRSNHNTTTSPTPKTKDTTTDTGSCDNKSNSGSSSHSTGSKNTKSNTSQNTTTATTAFDIESHGMTMNHQNNNSMNMNEIEQQLKRSRIGSSIDDDDDDEDEDALPMSTSLAVVLPETTNENPNSTVLHHDDDKENQKILKMSINTAVAIALHNFPEGLATFVATLSNPSVGAVLALAIAIHNIPEGLCVALPIYYATGRRSTAFFYAALSGISEPIAALVGYFLLANNFSDTLYAILFGIVAGMMVIISVRELLPTAHRYDPTDTVVTYSFIGGMMIIALSLVLFVN